MKTDLTRLKETYAQMETEALLELHSAGSLTEEAYDALESELRARLVAIPGRPNKEPSKDENQRQGKNNGTLWTKIFALIGAIIPIICLTFNFQPPGLMKVCELFWPTGFLLLGGGSQLNLPLALIAILVNSGLWAGLGWLIGYGASGRQ